MTVYKLWLNGKHWGHCYTFTAAYNWRIKRLEEGFNSVECYITKDRFPARVPVYGPLAHVNLAY